MLARKGYPPGVAIRAVKDALAAQSAEAAEFAEQIDADALADAEGELDRDSSTDRLADVALGARERCAPMLKACLNGGRDGGTSTPPCRSPRPSWPPTRSAARPLGVAAVHVHPRDAAGAESLDPAVIAAAVTAIRAARPGLPVGVSTGAWIVPDPAERVAAVRAWTVLPDFASVNAHEPGAAEVAAALHERGVLVEAGLWTLDARRRPGGRWRVPTGRILVECMAEEVAGGAGRRGGDPRRAARPGARRCCCTARARPPGRCRRGGPAAACTPGSGWRTRSCCPTAPRLPTTPRWCTARAGRRRPLTLRRPPGPALPAARWWWRAGGARQLA